MTKARPSSVLDCGKFYTQTTGGILKLSVSAGRFLLHFHFRRVTLDAV